MHLESKIKIEWKRGGVGCFQIIDESFECQISIFDSALLGNGVVQPSLLTPPELHGEGSQVELGLS